MVTGLPSSGSTPCRPHQASNCPSRRDGEFKNHTRVPNRLLILRCARPIKIIPRRRTTRSTAARTEATPTMIGLECPITKSRAQTGTKRPPKPTKRADETDERAASSPTSGDHFARKSSLLVGIIKSCRQFQIHGGLQVVPRRSRSSSPPLQRLVRRLPRTHSGLLLQPKRRHPQNRSKSVEAQGQT